MKLRPPKSVAVSSELIPMFKAIKTKKKKYWKLQGRYIFNGLPLSIENKAGSVRRGKDGDGHKWETHMYYDYGYVRNTEAKDGDAVDVYVNKKGRKSNLVFVVHQKQIEKVKQWKNGKCPDCGKHHTECKHAYDEDKVMLGFDYKDDAKKAYLKQYDSPLFLGPISTYTMDEFKENLKHSWGNKLPYNKLDKSCGDKMQKSCGKPHGKELPYSTKSKKPYMVKKSHNYESDEMYKKHGIDGESKEDYMKRMKKMHDKKNMEKGCMKKEYTVKQDGMEKSYLGQEGDSMGSRSMLKENIVNKPYKVQKATMTMSESLDEIDKSYADNSMPGEDIHDYTRRYMRENSGRQVNEMLSRDQSGMMEKAFVKQTTYTSKSGKTVHRKAYVDKRQKKVTHVKHSKMTRMDLSGEDARAKIEELKKRKNHHDLHIEAAKKEKKSAEYSKKLGNDKYAIGDKLHDVDKVIGHLNDHIKHHTNENDSHDNHIKKIQDRHETEAKHWEKKGEKAEVKKKAVVVKKELAPKNGGLTFSDQKSYMAWYRKQPKEVQEGHKLNREGGELVVTLGAKPEAEKKVVVAKKKDPKFKPVKVENNLGLNMETKSIEQQKYERKKGKKERFEKLPVGVRRAINRLQFFNMIEKVGGYVDAGSMDDQQSNDLDKLKQYRKSGDEDLLKEFDKENGDYALTDSDIELIKKTAKTEQKPLPKKAVVVKKEETIGELEDRNKTLIETMKNLSSESAFRSGKVTKEGEKLKDEWRSAQQESTGILKKINELKDKKIKTDKASKGSLISRLALKTLSTAEEDLKEHGYKLGTIQLDKISSHLKFAKEKKILPESKLENIENALTNALESRKTDSGKSRSEALKGNKNAYKGGPKEEPKKIVAKKTEPEKKEFRKPKQVVVPKEKIVEKPDFEPFKKLPIDEVQKLSTEKQKKYFGEMDEKGYDELQALGQHVSKTIDDLTKDEVLKLENRRDKLKEIKQDLDKRKVRRNANEAKKYWNDDQKLRNDVSDLRLKTHDLKVKGMTKLFPALSGMRGTVSDLFDKYGGNHGRFIKDLEKADFEIGMQNKRDYLIGDQKGWLTKKAILTTPEEYAQKLGIDIEKAKDLPKAFGQHLLGKYSGTTFFSKPNTDFDALLTDYWQKNKAKHSGRGIEVQKDEFKPKVSKDNHHDYSNDDHGFILPDLSTRGFSKFTKLELQGQGHDTVKRAAKEFEELKKSLIKSESLERKPSDRVHPSNYKVDGGYQIVDGRIFMRASVSRDKYLYRKDKPEPAKRPQTRKSFIYSPDVQLGTKGIVELKGGYKAELEMQRILYNQINHKSGHSNDLLDEVKKIGGDYGAHDFFQKAEFNENTGMIDSKVEGRDGQKISASMPLSRFKMMLSFFNAHKRGGMFGGGYIVPEKNLSSSVRDAMDIFKADQDAGRERISSTYYEAYLEGRETSFGKRNVEDDILDSHGVMIKRQNGNELSSDDKEALKKVVADTYAAIGNEETLSKMARDKKLKVSFSGDKMAYLTNAMGLYVPTESTVVIGKRMTQVLPHEFAHFMDDHLGDESKKGRGSYASEMPHTVEGKATILGRKTFTKASKRTQQTGGYWNRSCEVFARMVEQYAAVNHYNDESYYGKDGYWTKANYDIIKPEIEKVLKEKFGKSFAALFAPKPYSIKKVS
jgi:hypothetical protein